MEGSYQKQHFRFQCAMFAISSKPLLNKTAFAVCSPKKMSALAEGLAEMGATVFQVPVIEAKEIADKRALDEALSSLSEYSWIIFTSAYGISFFARRLEELGIPRNSVGCARICAVGPATAKTLKECGFETTLIPEKYVAEGVVQALAGYCGDLRRLAGNRILIPRALEARDVLPLALAEAGALVDVVPCYQTSKSELNETTMRQVCETVPDLVVFTSSSTIKNLLAILGPEYGKKLLLNATVAVLGPITAKTAESFGKQAEIVPSESTLASLLDAVRDYYRGRGKPGPRSGG
jgi:uroporphyrinogen III methyltransferase / synthase